MRYTHVFHVHILVLAYAIDRQYLQTCVLVVFIVVHKIPQSYNL